jgi:Uma2 family endonuclease
MAPKREKSPGSCPERASFMNEPAPDKPLTYEEFRIFVEDKDERYEFIDGRSVALASPSNELSRLATVLLFLIFPHVDGSGCDTHGNKDVWTGNRARRPDVVVTCDERDTGKTHPHALYFPKLVIKIVSGNKGDDFTDKYMEYQNMPSIEEYVLIDSTKHWIRRYHRSIEGKFIADLDQIGGTLYIASIGYHLDIDAMYARARV